MPGKEQAEVRGCAAAGEMTSQVLYHGAQLQRLSLIVDCGDEEI